MVTYKFEDFVVLPYYKEVVTRMPQIPEWVKKHLRTLEGASDEYNTPQHALQRLVFWHTYLSTNSREDATAAERRAQSLLNPTQHKLGARP